MRSAISIMEAPVTYQPIMEEFGYNYLLSANEQEKFEPCLQSIEEDEPMELKEAEPDL